VNTLKTVSLALLLALGFSSRAARAQEWTRQSFLLPRGDFEITGDPARPDLMRVNMSKNSAFQPVNFPVDFFWGVTHKVMLGITHETGPRFNTGVQNPKFRDTYNDVGFGSVIGLADGRNYEVDLHAGAPLHRLSPDIWVGAQIGVLGRANVARNVAFVYDPSLYFGLNHHNEGNLNAIDLSHAGRDGKPGTLGDVIKSIMSRFKVKVEASSQMKTGRTFFVKGESEREIEKAKRQLVALLSPVVCLAEPFSLRLFS